jgi:beta-lactamase superfamily II metal-dependent hydrolase
MAVHRPLAAAAVIALLSMALCAPAAAQWKWRDQNGRITISDLPPPRDVPQQNILQRPAPVQVERPAPAASVASAAAEPVQAPRVDPELQARKQAAEDAEAARQREQEAQLAQRRAENCRNARAHLAALDTGQRIARYNAQGEREIIDDQQRAAETRRARDVIASDCR